ncbi:REP-associated tyrosine transposase [Chitinilyticum litopenaei]|uniref:REP-associated tyrosine transposase n=1 Tax=Chitinilyticum litopenaei TaxID=1121276 RepID=UPI000408318A|nr:transposase [Chitinilyticum litopenaei]
MTNYRRDRTCGGTWFFTVNLAERNRQLLVEQIEVLRESFRQVMRVHPFRIDGIVVLPEHLHAILTLPAGDADYALRWRLIKTGFSRSLARMERISASRRSKGERGIWQRRYWEHLIRDDNDFARHLDYLHFNPVRHGHVQHVRDWPWSSFHRYVKLGLLPVNWGDGLAVDGEFGEG